MVKGEEVVAGKTVPALHFGATKMNNNFVLVDEVQKEAGGTATIFVKSGDEFVRVATNVRKNDGSRAIGTILTGALDDGTGGLLAIKQRGGMTVVQDPEDAFCPDMPRSALDYVKPDHIAKLSEIGPLLGRLAGGRVEGSRQPTPLLKDEAEIEVLSPLHGHETVGMPSPFSCPACGGVLNEVHEAGTVRFRCRTGHGFTPETALVEQRVTIESALWAALRALEEQAELAHRMATRARRQGSVHSAVRFEDRFEAARKQADVLRRLLAVEAGPQVA